MILGTWLVLLPTFLVLATAFKTRNLNFSLLIGIFTAALLAKSFQVIPTVSLIFERISGQLIDTDYLYIYAFLLAVGILIALINHTGAARTFAHTITKRLHNGVMVETASLLLSAILFIDDYLSSLTTGYVMRPLTDKYKIPRAKLAFLTHSMAGPLVILAPISSWVAYMTGQLTLAGIDVTDETTTKIVAEPFHAYLAVIPFILYPFAIIASTWFIVRAQISFGPMRNHEVIAKKTGNLFAGKKAPKQKIVINNHQNGSMLDLLIPIGTLIVLSVAGIVFLGNTLSSFFILCAAGTITLIQGFALALIRKTIKKEEIALVIKNGIMLMGGAVLMVLLASAFGIMLRTDLAIGLYLAKTLLSSVSIALLPCIFFLVSLAISTITGSSWGTMAIMLPVSVSMLINLLGIPTPVTFSEIPLLLPILGSIFSGAVCGDQISPISETTIMASTSAGCYPIDHTYTQIFYALPAIVGTAIAFVLSGFLAGYHPTISALVSITTAVGISCVLLYTINKFSKK